MNKAKFLKTFITTDKAGAIRVNIAEYTRSMGEKEMTKYIVSEVGEGDTFEVFKGALFAIAPHLTIFDSSIVKRFYGDAKIGTDEDLQPDLFYYGLRTFEGRVKVGI